MKPRVTSRALYDPAKAHAMVARLQTVAITTTPFTRLHPSTSRDSGSVPSAMVTETMEISEPSSRSLSAHSAFR